LQYTRDIPADATFEDKEKTVQHVRNHVAAVADPYDDPGPHKEEVDVNLHLSADGSILHVLGDLDAEPDAPYLKEGFNPFEGIDPDLLKAGMPDG
jgi:hypothetical protein